MQQQLREMYGRYTGQTVADAIGVTLRQVYQKAHALRLRKEPGPRSKRRPGESTQRAKWTPDMLQYLTQHYPDDLTADVAKVLGLRVQQVHRKAAAMLLRKSDAFMASESSGRGNVAKSLGGRFTAGFEPWNKGLHYEAGGRSPQTRFRPGNKPHTTLPVGSYRITQGKGYPTLEVKTSEDPGPNHKRWTPVHRLVWEQANGPVPAGHIVIFKTPELRTTVLEEITLDRLMLVSRAENANRNHWRTRHPELGNLFQLKGAITRQVNKIIQGATP